ncbi:MAG: hypothetical protein IPG00_20660 [Saprospiraceae bacterium]|nr:hypothetical protein [Saprospiraceae bacterium]
MRYYAFSINILNNDDFLANDGNTITNIALVQLIGTTVFDPITGELDYTPLAAEVGTTVTVVYKLSRRGVRSGYSDYCNSCISGDSGNDGMTDAPGIY